MEQHKFDDFTVPQVAEMLGVTRPVVMLWCRTRGWGYRLSPITPWRIPRERLERILAERDAAARGMTVTPDNSNSETQKNAPPKRGKLKDHCHERRTRSRLRAQ